MGFDSRGRRISSGWPNCSELYVYKIDRAYQDSHGCHGKITRSKKKGGRIEIASKEIGREEEYCIFG